MVAEMTRTYVVVVLSNELA